MLSKIYLGVLAIAIAVMAFFTYYAWSWLQSIGDPQGAWESFNYNKRTGVYVLIASTGLLLLIANIVLWMSRSAWAMWTSYIYFTVFVILLLVLMHLLGAQFCENNVVCVSPSRVIGPLLAAFGIVILGTLVFLNQFFVIRLNAKMFSVNERSETDLDEGTVGVEKNSRSETES